MLKTTPASSVFPELTITEHYRAVVASSLPSGHVSLMDIYFLRHGKADWPEWAKPDDERPLTGGGKKEMRKIAKFLDRISVSPDLIVTSPLPRAAQTAKIVAKKLGIDLREDRKLAPGFNAAKLKAMLKTDSSRDVMIVGHEPDFSQTVRTLTGGTIKLAKAGIAVVRCEPGLTKGKLIWLLSPNEMK